MGIEKNVLFHLDLEQSPRLTVKGHFWWRENLINKTLSHEHARLVPDMRCRVVRNYSSEYFLHEAILLYFSQDFVFVAKKVNCTS